MTLDELIAIVNAGYNRIGLEQNTIQAYHEDPEGEHGDALAEFMAVELRDTYSDEGCTDEQIEEAIRVIERAQRDLQAVIDALREEDHKNKETVPLNQTILIYCDGGCQKINGSSLASWAFSAQDSEGNIIAEQYAIVDQALTQTNNVAEYSAVIRALAWACKWTQENTIIIRSDSELVIKQLQGFYKVRDPKLLPLYIECQEACALVSNIRFEWVPREQNTRADALTQRAFDEHWTAIR